MCLTVRFVQYIFLCNCAFLNILAHLHHNTTLFLDSSECPAPNG
uniref:Uncharacterized protein n=1 Tax=Anguilla anguilla TaxID=7936 RepID=A0A0E9WWD7_ANGAN